MKDKKEYLFWRDVRKHIREECIIEADSLEKAVSLHKSENIVTQLNRPRGPLLES